MLQVITLFLVLQKCTIFSVTKISFVERNVYLFSYTRFSNAARQAGAHAFDAHVSNAHASDTKRVQQLNLQKNNIRIQKNCINLIVFKNKKINKNIIPIL